MKKYTLDFGKKEKVLNYACQTYQLSYPSKVGAVMALIRACQPKTFEEWENWYFDNALTDGKKAYKITQQSLDELGTRLYEKITSIIIPEWEEAFRKLTEKDCQEYIYNLTINKTFEGYLREKSVIYDGLAKIFPEVDFEESSPELDHAGDIDYLGKIGEKAFGIQIKPISSLANFGNYKPSERMKLSFDDFKVQFGGKVFIIYSLKGEIGNVEILKDIKTEIEKLKKG